MKHSRHIVGITLFGLFITLIVAGSSVLHYVRSQSRTHYESEQLATCRQLALKIQSLQTQPDMVGPQEIRHAELAQTIEQSAASAGINPAEQLTRIDPRKSRRLDNVSYLEKATDIAFVDITLKQLVRFLYQLNDRADQLQLAQLRLKAPHDDVLGDRWQVEATLSYVLFDPQYDPAYKETNLP